MANVEVLFI